MRLYLELSKRSFQRHLTYRSATIAGLITNFFFGILRATIFIALYDQQQTVEGITLQGAITYAALGQALIGFLSMFSWQDIANTVYTGDIASDLLKPMDYFLFWMSRDFGRALVQFLLRGVILIIGFEIVYNLYWPKSMFHFFAIIMSLFLSWVISFSWRFLINLSAFWTPNARGILRLLFVFSWFFSGFLMPLRFFPLWIQKVSYIMPFPHMFNSVIEVYLGTVKGSALLFTLANQFLWGIVLILIGQMVLRIGVKHLMILGG